MAKAVRYHKQGGPEVLQVDDVQVGEPGPGQVRVRHTAIGVNFVDTYQRSGLYPMQLPAVAGNEGAGVVEAVGSGVKDLKKGDRVAYTGLPGSYCDVLRSVQADWKGGSSTLRDPAAAARLASTITQIEASAPDEVKADWASLHTLVGKFTVADPDLAALTKQLQGFESSAKRIEVHAKETCQVDLTR